MLPDRRTFLSGLITLPVLGGSVAGAAAMPSGLGDLWPRFMLAQGSLTEAFGRLSVATDLLPWWAKEGPIYVGHDGAMSGPVRSWPALEHYELPPHEGGFQLIRIGPEEIRRREERRRWCTNPARAQELRAKDEAEMEARYARKAAEEQALGIPTLSRAHDDAFDVWSDIAEFIEGLSDGPIDVTAAKILVEMHRFVCIDATIASNTAMALAAVALRGLLPHLDGPFAVDVADVLADPDRALRDMRLSRGVLANGEIAGPAMAACS